MNITTKFDIGDVVALWYKTQALNSVEGRDVAAIIAGQIKSIQLSRGFEKQEESGELPEEVQQTLYTVCIDPQTGAFVNFKEDEIICEIQGFKHPEFEEMAQATGFFTSEMEYKKRAAERTAKEKCEAEEIRQNVSRDDLLTSSYDCEPL